MDMHDRLMKLSALDSIVFEILNDSFEELYNTIVKTYCDRMVDEKMSEVRRLLFCCIYRSSLVSPKLLLFDKSKIRSDPETLLFADRTVIKEFSIAYDVTALTLALFHDDKEFVQSFKHFYKTGMKHLETNHEGAVSCMRVFECFADACDLRLRLYGTENMGEKYKELLACILTAIEAWVDQESTVDWGSLASLLPKLVAIFGIERVTFPLQQRVLDDSRDLGKSLAILCVTADMCFPTAVNTNRKTSHERCIGEAFWSILLRGLVSGVYQERKQALYLVKRALDYSESNGSRTVCLPSTQPSVSLDTVCKGQDANVAKRHFFLILESLEEKHKHLVLPALTYLPDLAAACCGHKSLDRAFNVAWLRCVFERILQHDSVAVKMHGLREMLRAEFSVHDENCTHFLANSLNNVLLYERDEGSEKPPEIVTRLAEFFCRCDEANVPLINTFVKAISTVSWCPVAIYWILQALNEVPKHRKITCNIWSAEELRCVKSLVENNLTKHCKELRRKSQCLILRAFCAYNCAKSCPTDVKLVTDTLILMHECHSDPRAKWTTSVTEHLVSIVRSTDAQSYVSENCEKLPDTGMSVESQAWTIILLLEANLILNSKDCAARAALCRLFDNLIGANLRPYVDASLIFKVLELFSHLRNASNALVQGKTIDCLLRPYRRSILRLIETSFEKAELTNYDEYLMAIDAFLRHTHQDTEDLTHELKSLFDRCANIVVNPEKFSGRQWLYALRALNLYRGNEKPSYAIKLGIIDLRPVLAYFRDKVSNDSKPDNAKGKYIWDCCDNVACLLLLHIEGMDFSLQGKNINWLEDLLLLVQAGTERAIAPVAKILFHLLERRRDSILESMDTVDRIIRLSWRLAVQLNKSTVFYEAMTELIRLVMHPEFLKINASREFALQSVDQLMEEGKRVPSLRHVFVEAISFWSGRPNVGELNSSLFAEQLVSSLLHGEVPRQDQNIERSARSHWTEEDDESFSTDVNSQIRATAVVVLLTFLNETTNQEFLGKVLKANLSLLKKHRNKRYFDNSHVHRHKHRAMQTLLILEPYLKEDEARELYDTMCDLLITESNQPSVRLMQEWLLVRIYKNRCMHEALWQLFETAVEKRPGSVVSLAGIVYHLSRLLIGDTRTKFIEEAITHLLPNCMAQQFSVRLYSQTVLVKIFEMLPSDRRARYSDTYEAIRESLRRGSSLKNSLKIMDDFYFNVFHPNNDYNLQFIYHHLPRLTSLPADEWIPLDRLFSSSSVTGSFLTEPIKPGDPTFVDWSTRTVTKQAPRPMGDLDEELVSSSTGGLSDIQRKIVPWKSMSPFTDQLSEVARMALSRKNRMSEDAGIIVVASLIDRPPNLGGLARTCEIFGARELVLGSLRYTEDREFQTLSVSAEKWITITEVKPHMLKNYLLEQRGKGWKLVGAEQTANSTNLFEMKFDKKTVLLLGNEKDGIPANLIPILDTCVEIPQNGVVRSLNVHVTGAICVWQYVTQHVLA